MKKLDSGRFRGFLSRLWRRLRRRSAPPVEPPLEFGEVLDQVWEQKEWVLLRAGALERSWQAEARLKQGMKTG